ncbi:10992_t:CDS:2, partial [Paraglomus occultum]
MWRRYCKNRERNTVKEKVVDDTDQYHTDIETWDIMRRHDYPFIDFYQEHNSRIQVDNTSWNYVQENDNQFVDEPLDVANTNTLDVSTTYRQSSIRERQEALTRLKSLVIHEFDLAEENIQND